MIKLTPEAISGRIFKFSPDRDQRASNLCTEMLLVLVANGYRAGEGGGLERSPKVPQYALRSLVLEENFFWESGNKWRSTIDNCDINTLGNTLSKSADLANSEHIELVGKCLKELIDPYGKRGQNKGAWLLYPFQEEFLWYDARQVTRQGSRGEWTTRKVYMRGGGITLARILLAPQDENLQVKSAETVQKIQSLLNEESPLGTIAKRVSDLAVLDTASKPPRVEEDERERWNDGGEDILRDLEKSLIVHAHNITATASQHTGSVAALWALRNILGLDAFVHIARTAWGEFQCKEQEQYVLLVFGGPERSANRVRIASERSFTKLRAAMKGSIIKRLAKDLKEQAANKDGSWDDCVTIRGNPGNRQEWERIKVELEDIRQAIGGGGGDDENINDTARALYELFDYERTAENGSRVLMESIGLLAGTGQYRYLTAPPDLLAAMVYALAEDMPMTSRDFFKRLFKEWRIVIGSDSASQTNVGQDIDLSEFTPNERRAEEHLVSSGLAISLADSRTIVGHCFGN